MVLACCHTRCKHSSPALVGRPGQEGEPLAWDGSLSPCWLTFPSSSHSHSVILTVISKIHCKLPGTTFIILPGTPESQGPSSLQISGVPGPALGYPSGAAQNFVNFSGPRTGCTSLTHSTHCTSTHIPLLHLPRCTSPTNITAKQQAYVILWHEDRQVCRASQTC